MIFRYKVDRTPILLFTTYFLGDVFVYFSVDSFVFLLLWFLIGILPKSAICAWNHHHQHCFTFKQPIINRMLEIMYGLQTGIFGYTWVLHHNVGHHINFLDQTKDESRWKDDNGNIMTRFKYASVVSLTSYARAYATGKKHPKILKNFKLMVAVTLLILGGLTINKPLAALFVFWLPMMVSLYITADTTYNHHTGLDTQDPLKASRNIMSRSYNIITGNLGYHTAHHIKFGLHWSKLPAFHEKIKADIPKECFMETVSALRLLDRFLGKSATNQ